MRIWLLIALLLAGSRSVPASPAGAKFNAVAEDFLQGYLAWRPLTGVALGLHQYDGKITDYSSNSLAAELRRLKEFDRKLDGLDTKQLGTRAYYDYRILCAEIHRELFKFEDQKVYTDNPMTYAGAVDLNIYIKRD